MDHITDIVGARTAITSFLMAQGGALGEDELDMLVLLSAVPSPVDQMCQTAELIYARRGDMPAEGLALGAELATFCGALGLQGLGDASRGILIAQALRGEPEPATGWPDPRAELVRPPEVAA